MKITKKSFQAMFTRASFAGLLLAGVSVASAQTSGSLSTAVSVNYSTAPWVITSGSGTYPDGGGVATFNEQVGLTALPAVPVVTVDVPVTLSGLTFNSVYQYQIVLGAGTLALSAAGGTLNVATSNASSPTLFSAGDVISAVISGGGTGGLIKTGTGIISVTGTNTYAGGTTINGGTLRITSDAALGATGTGNDVTINGGTLRPTTAITTARNFTLGSSGGTFELFANTTVNGIVSGGGSLTHTVGSTLTLTGANTYTGTTTQTAGSLTVSGINGTVATSSSYDLAGIVNLDSSTASNSNRLSDTATITARGLTLNLTGNATAATTEAAGVLNLASGNNIIALTPNAAQPASLGFASINRLNNSTLVVRGTNLGATPANGVAQITSTASPGTLIGGGGAAGSTTISILPWAIGNVGAAATLGSSFVTYSGGAFRPLATTEYAAAIGGSATDNVRFTATTAAPTGTVNSLVFAPGAAATLSGGPITITSGAFLYSPTVAATGTVSAGLDFGAAEGILSNASSASTLTVSGVITGSGGLTVNNVSGTTIFTGANTYTGATRINTGQLTFGGTIDPATAGPLGQTSAPIILNVGSATTRLWVNADSTINRNISVQGNPAVQFTAGLGATATFNITLNGNLDLQRRVAIENGSTLPFTINGVVSGPGSLTDAFSSLVVLNGNNTYTGGTEIQAGTYQLGSDTGFGTGTVFFSGLGTVLGSGTTTRAIANNFLYNTATATFGGTVALNFTGAQNLNGNRTFAVNNTALTTFSGPVTSGSITKTGTGAIALNNATGNAFTGGFANTGIAATASAIYANNTSGSAFGTGALTVGAASGTVYSTLSGTFTTAGPATVAGRLSPGNTPLNLTPATAGVGAIGTETFGTTLTLATSTSSLYLEAASASSVDKLNVGGVFTLAGTVTVVSLGGYTVQAGDSLDFFDAGSVVNGGFTLDTTGLALASGVTLNTTAFATTGVITAVPEPGTLGLLGAAGGLGIAGWLRRRRSAVRA